MKKVILGRGGQVLAVASVNFPGVRVRHADGVTTMDLPDVSRVSVGMVYKNPRAPEPDTPGKADEPRQVRPMERSGDGPVDMSDRFRVV